MNIKSVIAIAVLSITAVSDSATAQDDCDDPDSPEDVRVYYGNGIQNTSSDIFDSLEALIGVVKKTEDREFGKSINTSEGLLQEVLDIARDKSIEPKAVWSWISRISLAPQWFKDAYNDYVRRTNQIYYNTDVELRVMVGQYVKDLSAGKKVVIVSHSQGNLYANKAYQYIADNYDEFKDSIGIVAVGSVAGIVQDDGYHSTNSIDNAVNLVRAYAGYHNVLRPTFTYDEPNDPVNHNFINTYLEADWRNIREYVVTTIYSRLKSPPRRGECEIPVEVDTGGVSDVTSSRATVNGKLTSGENAYVWLERADNNTYPAACVDNASDKPDIGEFNTGDDIVFYLDGLSDNTNYNYRICAKGGGNGSVSDGGMKNFKTYANCGESFDAQGGTDGLETTVAVGYDPLQRFVEVKFDAFGIPDKLVIKNARSGSTMYSTDGFVSGEHRGSFRQDNPQGIVKVIVTGNSDGGTQWELTVGCTGEELPDSIRSTNLEEIQNTVESTVR